MIRGTHTTRRTPADSSSSSPPGTPLADRIAPYTMSPPPRLRSRCVVRTSSGLVGTHGATAGLQRRVFAAWGEWGWTE